MRGRKGRRRLFVGSYPERDGGNIYHTVALRDQMERFLRAIVRPTFRQTRHSGPRRAAIGS